MSTTSENNKRIAKNTALLYVRMLLIMAITFYTSRVILQVLGIEDYGIYNVVGGVVSMMSFLNTSIANGFQRFFSIEIGVGNQQKVRQLFSTAIAIQILITICIYILAETFGLWFLNTQMNIAADRMVAANWVFQSSLFIFIITMFRAPYSAIIIANEKMSFYAYISIIEVILNLLIVFTIKHLSCDLLIGYSFLTIIVSVLIFCSYYIFIHRCFSYLTIHPSFNHTLIKKMLSFSGWNLFGSLAHLMKGQGLNILLNIFFGPVVNAARGIAFQVQAGITVFVSNFQLAARPQTIKHYAAGNFKEMKNLFFAISKYSFFLLWLLSLPLLFQMEFILHLWLGDKIPSYAPLFSRLTLVTALIESFASPLTTIVHATGKMKKFQITCGTIILMIVPISYLFLLFDFPPETAMYISLIIVTVVHGIRLILLKGLIDFSIKEYFQRVLTPTLIVVVISLSISLIIYKFNYIENHILFMISIFFIVLLTIFLYGFSQNEKIFITNKVKNKLHQKHY